MLYITEHMIPCRLHWTNLSRVKQKYKNGQRPQKNIPKEAHGENPPKHNHNTHVTLLSHTICTPDARKMYTGHYFVDRSGVDTPDWVAQREWTAHYETRSERAHRYDTHTKMACMDRRLKNERSVCRRSVRSRSSAGAVLVAVRGAKEMGINLLAFLDVGQVCAGRFTPKLENIKM